MSLQDSPFHALTIPELSAYTFKNYGADGLRWVMANRSGGTKEGQQDHIKELRKLGLHEAAEILEEYAETLPSQFDECFCEYLRPKNLNRPGNDTNIRSWRARNELAKKRYEADHKELPRKELTLGSKSTL